MELARLVLVAAAAAVIGAAPAPAVTVITSAVSRATFRLDTREGPRESMGTETITYSTRWHTNATVAIYQDGVALGDAERLVGEGNYVWSVPANGTYTLWHVVDGVVAETATFIVRGLDAILSIDLARAAYGQAAAGSVAVLTNGVAIAADIFASGASNAVLVAKGSDVSVVFDAAPGYALADGCPASNVFTFVEDRSFAPVFLPNPDAALRWKYSSAVGRYFAQVAIPAHPGYTEALDGLAFLFADRANNVGEVFAQLWDAAARAPQGVLLTDNGVEYRGVSLGSSAFAGEAEGTRVLWGVKDATFAETRLAVPAGERQIGLYVRKRVDPVSGNESVAEVGNFLGYLTWMTDGIRYFLPVVEGDANGPLGTTPAQLSSLLSHSSTPNSSTPNSHSSLFTRAYSPATLSAAITLGLTAETVADSAPAARIAAFGVAADGAVSGRVEVVAGDEASSSFGPAATVRILSAPGPAGPWAAAASAEVDPATGAFALPAGAVEGHFFRAEIETKALYE